MKKIKRNIENKKNFFVVTNIRNHIGIKYLKKNINLVGQIFFTKAFFTYTPKNIFQKKFLEHQNLYVKYCGIQLLDACHTIDYLKFLIGPIVKSNTFLLKGSNRNLDKFYSSIFHQRSKISMISNMIESSNNKKGCEIYGVKGVLKWMSFRKLGKEKVNVKFISNNKKIKNILNLKGYKHDLQYKKQIFKFKDNLDTLNVILNSNKYEI